MKGDLLLLLDYADSLVKVEDFGAANLYLKQALDLAPRHEAVTNAYARFLLRLTEKMKAVGGGNNKAYRKGVKVYLKRAEKTLKRGLKTNPIHIPSLLARCQIMLTTHELSRAAEYAERALREDPYNLNALLLFAECAAAASKLQVADKYFRDALSLNSADVDVLIAYSILNIRAGDYDKAEGLYSRALLLHSENPRLLASYYDNVLLSITQVKPYMQNGTKSLIRETGTDIAKVDALTYLLSFSA